MPREKNSDGEPTVDRWITRYISETPDGRELVPIPWEQNALEEQTRVPGSLTLPMPSATFLLCFFAAIGFLFGITLKERALAASSAAILATCLFAYRNAWRQTGSHAILSVSGPPSIVDKHPVVIKVKVLNTGDVPLPSTILRLEFDGSRAGEYYSTVSYLAPDEEREISFTLVPEFGMGTYQIGPVQTIVQDPLGLFRLCSESKVSLKLEVLPEIIPIESFPIDTRGLASHSGEVRDRTAGDSISFLGLRDYRQGDSIRKIDWKRSLREDELIVKQFETECAVDITLLLDLSARGHSEFETISSLKTMKDSCLSLASHFLQSQQRVQLIAEGLAVPLGTGSAQTEMISRAVMNLKLVFRSDFAELLARTAPLIPSGSLACIFFCTASSDIAELAESLFALENRRVETFLILFDSEAFAKAVTTAAHLETQTTVLQYFGDGTPATRWDRMGAFLSRLPARTLFIRPGQTLADHCHPKEFRRRAA